MKQPVINVRALSDKEHQRGISDQSKAVLTYS